MRWWVFVPVLLVCVVLDLAFMPVFSVAGYQPSLTVIVVAFVALFASRFAVVASALLAGVLADLLVPGVMAGKAVPVIGPHALAWCAAAVVVMEARDILYRRNALTAAATTMLMASAQALVFVALAGLRLAYADPAPLWGAGSGARAFGIDLVDALYTAVLALPVSWVLLFTLDGWGFAEAGPRFARR